MSPIELLVSCAGASRAVLGRCFAEDSLQGAADADAERCF